MSSRIEQLLAASMALSEADRSDLAARIIESLDTPFDDGVEAAWREEVERRIDEMDAGIGKTISWPEARRRILGKRDDSAAA